MSNWRIFWPALALGGAALVPAPALAGTHERLEQLARTYIESIAQFDPLRATQLGLAGHDAELPVRSEKARAGRIAQLRMWRSQVDAIVAAAGAGIDLVDRDDARLLKAQFTTEIDDYEMRQADRKNYAAAGVELTDGIFTQFLTLPIPGTDGATPADLDRAWDDLVTRLEKGPAFIEAGQRLATKPGHLQGLVGSERLGGVDDFFRGALTDAAQAQLAGRPAVLQRFAAARDAVLSTLAQSKTYIDAHVPGWPENYAVGKRAYNAILRDEQLLPFNDADLERMASDELAHGWAVEAWLAAESARSGVSFGAASGGGLAPSGPALVDYYRARMQELRQYVVDHRVVTMPSWLGSMKVVETPAFMRPVSPGASMVSPRLFSASTTGYYFITPPTSLEEAARRLDMNEDFDRDRIWSTGAHESIPGHFFQLSIARRHPDFVRKIQSYASFEEGWAFYGEEMLVQLGLYGDDLDARLFTARWERVRGARAIVDPKLATGEWSVEQAVDFYETQSGFTREAAQAAVNAIALGPAYFIAYTVGRFQLETLLGEYQRRTGAKGSLQDFHDRLLSYGSVPFSIVAPELLADLDKPAAEVRAAAAY